MLRVNLVKIYNDATLAARKECNITLPEDPEYFSVINKYKAWRKEKKLKKTSGSPKKSRKTDSGSSDSEDSDQFSEPDTSSEETDIDNLSLEDRIRRAAYPKRSRLDVSREGAKGDVTPLGKAKKFALWKLKTAKQMRNSIASASRMVTLEEASQRRTLAPYRLKTNRNLWRSQWLKWLSHDRRLSATIVERMVTSAGTARSQSANNLPMEDNRTTSRRSNLVSLWEQLEWSTKKSMRMRSTWY